MSKTEFRLTMTDLFRVWKGTENADMILEDVCYTFAQRAFKMEQNERIAFLRACRGYRK